MANLWYRTHQAIIAQQAQAKQAKAQEPPPTDPDKIGRLWRAVRSMPSTSSTSKPSKGSGIPTRQSKRLKADKQTLAEPSGSESSKPTPPSGSRTRSGPGYDSFADDRSTTWTDRTTATRAISPRSADFDALVLRPRGINVLRLPRYEPLDACTHFGTQKLHNYGRALGYEDVLIWVDYTKEELQAMKTQYCDMATEELCEEEFSWYALATMLKGPLIASSVPYDSRMRVRRMLQLVINHDTDLWQHPPIVHEQLEVSNKFTWDLRPDAAYWLSTKGFNDEYNDDIFAVVFLPEPKKIICPYLTIDFKRHGEKDNVAINQVAGAGSIALYNRWILHCDAQMLGSKNTKGVPNAATPTDSIRHYALTWMGTKFHIWCLTPRIDERKPYRWGGCTVQELSRGDCRTTPGLEKLALWINEIHRWGLTIHAESCKAAVKALLQGTQNTRVSDFGSIPDSD